MFNVKKEWHALNRSEKAGVAFLGLLTTLSVASIVLNPIDVFISLPIVACYLGSLNEPKPPRPRRFRRRLEDYTKQAPILIRRPAYEFRV